MEIKSMEDFNEQARCIECGDFYHKEAMKGNICFSCAGDEEEREYE